LVLCPIREGFESGLHFISGHKYKKWIGPSRETSNRRESAGRSVGPRDPPGAMRLSRGPHHQYIDLSRVTGLPIKGLNPASPGGTARAFGTRRHTVDDRSVNQLCSILGTRLRKGGGTVRISSSRVIRAGTRNRRVERKRDESGIKVSSIACIVLCIEGMVDSAENRRRRVISWTPVLGSGNPFSANE
jgi:hypothetical protein